jgi:4-amino-4-deoxy-L-arabinose transferase-like glycosyltransferase
LESLLQLNAYQNIASSTKLQLAILVLVCLLTFFFRLGSYGLIDPGDGYFSEAAREMIEIGNYITPHLNYQIYFSKPILIYWLIASAYSFFGVNEFAARFWSAVLASFLVFGVYFTGSLLKDKKTGLMAALILASSPEIITFAKMSLVDMAFSSFLGIALCATACTIFSDKKQIWPIIYIVLALAVLTKGPAAIVLYVLAMLGYLIFSRPNKAQLFSLFSKLNLPFGMFIFLIIALPWYVFVGLATDWLWPKVFFLFENLGRFAGETNHKHPQPWFYLLVIAYGFFPWILYLPAASIYVYKLIKNKIDGVDKEPVLLFASWALTIFLFFSLSQTKLQTYILPIFPALALLIAYIFTLAIDTVVNKTLRFASIILYVLSFIIGIAILFGLFLFAIPSIIMQILPKKIALLVMPAIISLPVFIKLMLIAGGCVIFWGFFKQYNLLRNNKWQESIMLTIFSISIACAFLAAPVFEIAYQLRQADLHKVILCLKNLHDGPVAIYQEFKPSVMFYLERPVDSFFSPDQLLLSASQENKKENKQYIIAGKKGSEELLLKHGNKLKLINQIGHWYVFESNELIVQKLPTLAQTFSLNMQLSGKDYHWGTLPFAGGIKPMKGQ